MTSPQIIAKDILLTIRQAFEVLRELQSVRPFSNEEQAIFQRIGALMPILFDKIVRHYEDDEQAHIQAFQLKFQHPEFFKDPQTLEIIISYLYGVLKSIQQKSSYMFFSDYDHMMYVEQLVNANKAKILSLINTR